MNHLEASGDGRLEKSCLAARTMCGMRPAGTDPKPWFYSGLFSAATREEAQRFLSPHLVTKAAIPSMEDDEDVRLWLEGVGSATRELLQRLRASIAEMGKPSTQPSRRLDIDAAENLTLQPSAPWSSSTIV
jgi:hypothetical protein